MLARRLSIDDAVELAVVVEDKAEDVEVMRSEAALAGDDEVGVVELVLAEASWSCEPLEAAL